MKTMRRCLATAAVGVMALGLGPGRADEPRPGDKPRTLVLFDGKTLDGWKRSEFYKPGEVKVEDGAIVMEAGKPMTGVTSTRDDLPKTNYELSYEAKKLDGTDFFAAATFPVGRSHITLVNGGWGGHVTGLSNLNGSNASENETSRSFRYKDKTWYKFRVRVTDEAIRYSLDGKEIAAVDYRGQHVGTRTESNASKPLGFATYETRGAVRNIEMRGLTPDEVAAANKIE